MPGRARSHFPSIKHLCAYCASSSRGVSVGPATVSAKRMDSMTAVSVEDTFPSEANTAITMSRNRNQFSLNAIPFSASLYKVCAGGAGCSGRAGRRRGAHDNIRRFATKSVTLRGAGGRMMGAWNGSSTKTPCSSYATMCRATPPCMR